MNPLIAEVLLQAGILILKIGMSAGIVVGLILLMRPELISNWNRKLNKWYSTRRALRVLEMVHDTDPWFLKNHRVYGGFMLLASLVLLYFMLFSSTPPTAYDSIQTPLNADQFLAIKFIYYVLLVATAISVPLWIILMAAPGVLERVMPPLNQWISTRMMLRKVDEVNSRYDEFVLKNPRTFGIIFIAGSVLGMALLMG